MTVCVTTTIDDGEEVRPVARDVGVVKSELVVLMAIEDTAEVPLVEDLMELDKMLEATADDPEPRRREDKTVPIAAIRNWSTTTILVENSQFDTRMKGHWGLNHVGQ